MKIPFFLIIFVQFILLISMMNSYELSESILSQSLIIQGTHHGGCGFGFITKKNIVESIKKYLLKNVSNQMKIELKFKNYKTETDDNENYKTLDSTFNDTEFNIFIIFNNTRKLVGSSDFNDKNYYPYLAGTSNDSDEFLKSGTEKIINFMKSQVEI
jgi:hypothetical protein